MATLEKIRSKSVILFIIIIVALLAFILGDFLTSSRSLTGPGTTAAKVAGQKIDFQQFQNTVEQQREQLQQQGYQDVDISMVQNQVLEQLIIKALLDKEIEELGIEVTKEELSSAMVGDNALPGVVQYARNYGFASPSDLYNAIFVQGTVPAQVQQPMQQEWLNMENQVKEMLLQQKLATLLSGSLQANKLDARAYYDENAHTAKIAYTKKDFSTVTDEEAPVTSEDMKAIYNSQKKRYELAEATRPVDYILIDIVPSADDKLAAQQEVEAALIALKEQPGTDGVSDNRLFVVNRKSTPEYMLSSNIKNNLDSLKANGVQLLQFRNNVYNIAKLVDTYNDVDSATFDVVLLTVAPEQRDSIVGLLNSGESVDSLKANGLVADNAVDQKAYIPEMAQLTETLKTAPIGTYVIPEFAANDQGATAVKVTRRNAPVAFYDVAEITYKVDPSVTTVNQLRADLKAYADTNNTATLFAENALKGGYRLASAKVTPSSLSIANIKDTRSPAKWAMNAKKGQVSNVYGDEQVKHFIVVAVKDIYDKGYTPASDEAVTRELSTKARAQKRGEKLMADYKGKANNVQGYADLMGAPVDTTEVTFGQNIVKGFSFGESALIANASVAQPGTVVGPFVTDNAIVVIEVVDVEDSPREFDYDNDALMFNQQQGSGLVQRNLNQILIGRNKITNNLQQFYVE